MSSRYYSNLSQPRVRPSDSFPAAGVFADPLIPKSIIGVAYPYTHIGGLRLDAEVPAQASPPEVVWRLVIDRTWDGSKIFRLSDKLVLAGRYVLRDGEFVELAEEAI